MLQLIIPQRQLSGKIFHMNPCLCYNGKNVSRENGASGKAEATGMNLTIAKDIRTEQVISKSRFICSLKKVKTEEEAQEFIKAVKKEFWDATHNCSAYVIDEQHQRSSDDGEPSGTAGMPMLGVLRKQELQQVAAVVTRYFGGIKLGAGGLVRAYAGSVAQAVEAAGLAQKEDGPLCIFLRPGGSGKDNQPVISAAVVYTDRYGLWKRGEFHPAYAGDSAATGGGLADR